MAPAFVDVHSHVLPSGDDGAKTLADGRALCRGAARHGTRLLFATPHVWPHLPLTPERELEIRRSLAQLAPGAGLELRLGFELTPTTSLLDEDPHRYALAGTDSVLMEARFEGALDIVIALAEHVEAAGLRPVIAHPERAEAVLADPALAFALAKRGWPLQINATSITGWHGPAIQAVAWQLLENGAASLVASDGHREARPPYLDAAFDAVAQRLSHSDALPLFDGSALGFVHPVEPALASAA